MLYGGCEVQDNFIIIYLREIGVSALRVRLRKKGKSLEMSQTFCASSTVLVVVLAAMT